MFAQEPAPSLNIKPVFDGERSISVIEQALHPADSADHAIPLKSVFPTGVNSDVLAYCIIASVEYEVDPGRIERLLTALSKIADLDPPRLVRIGIDWPELLNVAPLLATMNFAGPFKEVMADGRIRHVGTTAFYESPLFSGQFPGNRHLTFGQLAREAILRVKTRNASND